MQRRKKYFISPNFTYEKLQPPFFKDLVDVFEDRILYWMIEPAKALLELPHGEVAAVSLVTSYMEAIEIYGSGSDSKQQSREFFTRGFKKVFSSLSGPDFMHEAIAKSLYELLRCGFAHEGIFRHKINFSSVRPEAILISWPKKEGEFDPNGKLSAAVINPRRFVEGVEEHFRDYIRQLRRIGDSDVKVKFKAAVDLKWNLNDEEPFIAMTEEEFYGGAKQ